MKFIHRFSVLAPIILLVSCAATQIIQESSTDQGIQESSTDWQSLFIDNKLKQWQIVGDEIWNTQEGMISVTPAETVTFLQSVKSYDNFHLKLDFWVNDNTNSGVFFRCTDGAEINPINCYEANIWDNHPNQAFRTGALVTIAEPASHVETLDKWNSYEIIANGNDITLKVNDQLTSRIQHDKLSSGRIALQYAGKGMVRFRNIVIKEL